MSDTPITDLLEQMRAAGCSLDAAIPAVRVLELSRTFAAVVPDKEEIIREYERARKTKTRAKSKANKGGAKANDVAPRATNVPDKVPDATIPSCDLSSFLKKETSDEGRKKEGNTRARGTRIVAGAMLSDADRAFARGEGMSDAWIDRAWAEFIDYWIGIPGNRGTKLNWSATWRNRVRQIAPKGKQHETTGNVIVAADRLLERVRAFDDRPSGIRDGTGSDTLRLLSKG